MVLRKSASCSPAAAVADPPAFTAVTCLQQHGCVPVSRLCWYSGPEALHPARLTWRAHTFISCVLRLRIWLCVVFVLSGAPSTAVTQLSAAHVFAHVPRIPRRRALTEQTRCEKLAKFEDRYYSQICGIQHIKQARTRRTANIARKASRSPPPTSSPPLPPRGRAAPS